MKERITPIKLFRIINVALPALKVYIASDCFETRVKGILMHSRVYYYVTGAFDRELPRSTTFRGIMHD